MKPLNIFIHFKSNIHRILPTILTISLEFAVLTFMISIGSGVSYAANYNLSGYFDRTLYFHVDDSIDKDKVISDIEEFDNVKIAVNGGLDNTPAMLPIMYTGNPFYKIDNNSIDEFINKADLKVVEGAIPKTDKEVVITKEAAEMLNSSVGDYIGRGYDKILNLADSYKVVGLIEGDYSCLISGYNKVRDGNLIIVQCNKGTNKEVKDKIKDLYPNFKVEDCSDLKFFSENIEDILIRLGFLAVGIFSIVILITVINLSKSLISNFSEEYSLLKAIGYNNKVVNKRICSLLGFILVVSALLGIGIGIVINVIFNNVFCISRGIAYEEFNNIMFTPMIVSLILFLIVSINTIFKIKKSEFMEVMDI